MRSILAISIIFFCSLAVATETTKLTAVEHFEEQKALILKDISDDTVYNEIEYSDVKLVKQALDLMSDTLTGVSAVEELSDDDKAHLFNQQGLVNTILTMAENDSRVVCRRKRTLGTNFKTTTCESVKDRRARQEADRLTIESFIKGTEINSN